MEEILKTYDIRGVYPSQIDEEKVFLIGKALPSFFKGKNIAIGRDGRISSPSLLKSLIKGIREGGGEVVSIGICSTPLLSFTVSKYNLSGGVMVTASHNPKEFNGLKIIKEKGLQAYGDEIKALGKMASKGIKKTKEGALVEKDPLRDYLDHLFSLLGKVKDIKVVTDYGNGVASVTGRPFFKEFGVKEIPLFDEIDGEFPNHPANPHDLENMETLIERVKKEKADLGVFFDGDGDRSFLIDEKGEVVFPDLQLALLSKEELKKYPGEKVYYDLRSSKVLEEKIKEMGGVPVMMKVGNPFYKEKLIKEGGVLAGELSGHVMFRENYSIDDGLFSAAKTIKLMEKEGKPLSKLINPFKKYFSSEEINIEVKDKDKAMKRVKLSFKDGKHFDIDGVYVDYQSWWFSLRKSNTEDLVRLRLEAESKELLEEKRKELISLIY